MKKLILSLVALSVIISFPIHAQVIELSLEEALELALENNRSIKSAEFNEEIAKAAYNQSKSSYLPSLELSITGVKTNDPLSSFGFKLKQEIVTQADFNPSLLKNPLSINNFSSKLEMRLPLFNLDGLYENRAARLHYESSTFMKNRSIQYVLFKVKKAYYNIELADEVIRVVNESVKMAESALKLTLNNLEVGYAKDADVLMAKVRLGDIKAKLMEAKSMKDNAEAYLAFLLGLNEDSDFETSSQLENSPQLKIYDGSILNRSDVMAIEAGVKASKYMFSSKKSGLIPRINAFGSTEWNDDKLLGANASSYTIGAVLSWKLFNGYKNIGGVQKAKVQYKKSKNEYADYVSKNELEIQKAERSLKLAYEHIQIKRLSQEQALESYRIINNRYAEGLEKSTDLLYAENLASNRKLEFIESLYKYQVALAYMELLLEK